MEPCPKPLTVETEGGVLLVDGACGVAITLTPEAALATAELLFDEATLALGQSKMLGRERGLPHVDSKGQESAR